MGSWVAWVGMDVGSVGLGDMVVPPIEGLCVWMTVGNGVFSRLLDLALVVFPPLLRLGGAVGYSVGVAVGCAVGIEVGSVGFGDMVIVGVALGATVGESVGCTVLFDDFAPLFFLLLCPSIFAAAGIDIP